MTSINTTEQPESYFNQAWSNRIEKYIRKIYEIDTVVTRNGASYGFSIRFENETECLMCVDFSYLFGFLWREFRLRPTSISLNGPSWREPYITTEIMEGNEELIIFRENEIHREGETVGR